MKYEEYTGNGSKRGRSPAEIEYDLASIRSEMSDTLQRLEERFSPRALIEQLFSRARGMGGGPSAMAGNLGTTVRDNPVPVLLLAAGVASLMASERSSRRGGGRGPVGERLEALDETLEGTEQPTHESIAERARHVTGGLGARASQLRERARVRAGGYGERAGELRERARERSAVLRERAQHQREVMGERARAGIGQARDYGTRTLQEEPLVVVGLGLALGALLGAGSPVSERERSLIGGRGRATGLRERIAAAEEDIIRGTPSTTSESLYDTDITDPTGDERSGGGGFGGAEPPI